MNARTTIMLAALLLALVLALLMGKPQRRPALAQAIRPLPDFVVNDVVLLGVASSNGGFECVRNNGVWLMSRPVSAKANPAVVEGILAALEQMDVSERLPENELARRGLRPADYGLEPPLAKITIGTRREKFTLELGDSSTFGDLVYTRLHGAPDLFAVSNAILSLANMDAAAVRDPRLVRVDADAVARLEIKPAGRPLIYLAREGRSWVMQKPVAAQANARRARDLIDRILRLEARAFVSETMADPLAYGIAEDEAALQIGLGFIRGGQSHRLSFGKQLVDRPDLIYACSHEGNAVVAVERGDVEALSVRPEDIRSRSLPLPELNKVNAIRLERGESALLLLRAGGRRWQMLEPERCQADAQRVEALLRYLGNLRVQAFWPAVGSSAPAIDMSRPSGRLWLSTAAFPARSASLETELKQLMQEAFCLSWQAWGASNRFLAATAHTDEFLELPPGMENALGVDFSWFRDLTVLEIEPSTVRRITLRVADARPQALDCDNRGEWRATPVSPGLPDVEALRDLLAWAAELRAIRSATDAESEAALSEWQTPKLSITFGLAGEKGIQITLRVGGDSRDGARAMVQGREAVWIIDRAMPARLRKNGLILTGQGR